MTTKTFRHSFHPWQENPVPGRKVKLSIEHIEAAGVREVLRTPGAALGSWSLLDALLAKCDEFRFVEPLGQAREVWGANSNSTRDRCQIDSSSHPTGSIPACFASSAAMGRPARSQST